MGHDIALLGREIGRDGVCLIGRSHRLYFWYVSDIIHYNQMETPSFRICLISLCFNVYNRTQLLYSQEMEQTYRMRYVFGMCRQFLAVAPPIPSLPSRYDAFLPGRSRLVSLLAHTACDVTRCVSREATDASAALPSWKEAGKTDAVCPGH